MHAWMTEARKATYQCADRLEGVALHRISYMEVRELWIQSVGTNSTVYYSMDP